MRRGGEARGILRSFAASFANTRRPAQAWRPTGRAELPRQIRPTSGLARVRWAITPACDLAPPVRMIRGYAAGARITAFLTACLVARCLQAGTCGVCVRVPGCVRRRGLGSGSGSFARARAPVGHDSTGAAARAVLCDCRVYRDRLDWHVSSVALDDSAAHGTVRDVRIRPSRRIGSLSGVRFAIARAACGITRRSGSRRRVRPHPGRAGAG